MEHERGFYIIGLGDQEDASGHGGPLYVEEHQGGEFRSDAQELSEQAGRQREAGRASARESAEAYAEFLDDAFSRYRSGAERAAGSLSETTAGLVGTATGAVGATAGATVEGAERAAEAAAFPIAGYDEMNVEQVSERLDDLFVEELQLIRDYEERNKRRETLLERMDRKIRAA